MIPPDDDTVRIGAPTFASDPRPAILASRESPAEALRAVVARLLDDGPCFVAFSGGCDSSLILAVATEACRASGHADPIPVTYRFSQAAATNEQEYQEVVIRHLGLRDWLVLDLDHDGDLLGPPATSALQIFGSAWPPTAFAQIAAMQQLDEGLFLTGEGGDELLGWRRVSPVAKVAQLARRRRIPSRAQTRVAFEALVPRQMKKSFLLRHLEESYGAEWVAPPVRHELLGRLAELEAAEPLRAKPYLEYVLGLPPRQVGHHNVRAMYAHYGLRWEAPLYDSAFLGSLAGLRWYDYRGRTEILRRYFSDLLPTDITERRTKAVFNGAYLGRPTREFARRWNGDGLPDGVDPDWLKDHWCNAPEIKAGTAMLLHRAWLATEGSRAADPPVETAPRSPGAYAADRASE